MSNTITLDTIRAKADENYSHTPIDFGTGSVVLRNALQLEKADRAELLAHNKKLSDSDDVDGEGTDQAEAIKGALRIVADDKNAVEALFDAVGDNLAVLVQIFRTYNEGTQVGEA